MIDNEKSPIIERLIEFIRYSGLTNSQFADKAGIPRPSLSQLLHGRNKSLNNQMLAKLDEAFPGLNVMWLLFGRGEMLNSENFRISEPQTDSNLGIDIFETLEDKPIDDFMQPRIDFSISDQSGEETVSAPQIIEDLQKRPSSPGPIKKDNAISLDNLPLSSSALAVSSESRKISTIIVLYSDGTCETFKPSGNIE